MQTEQAVENADIFAKLCEEEALLREQKQPSEDSRELWDREQVAKYFGLSEDHTAKCVITHPRFPAPVDIKGRTGGRSKDLYISGEVVRFCLQNRKPKHRI